jgi:hypothetical protein
MTKDKSVGKHPKIEEQKGSFNPFDKYTDRKTSSNEDFKRKICYGFNKNHRQNYIPDNLATAFHIVALKTPARAGNQGDHVLLFFHQSDLIKANSLGDIFRDTFKEHEKICRIF